MFSNLQDGESSSATAEWMPAVDTETVSATGRNGVLEISIAKHAKAQTRRITSD
jgi:HSP20 family molecular chaperone IbpA